VHELKLHFVVRLAGLSGLHRAMQVADQQDNKIGIHGDAIASRIATGPLSPITVRVLAQLPPTGAPIHKTNVGAGLLAKAVCQSHKYRLIQRLREQARSHSFNRCCIRSRRSVAVPPGCDQQSTPSDPAPRPVRRSPATCRRPSLDPRDQHHTAATPTPDHDCRRNAAHRA
jgi:hypothetical protein